MRYSRGMYIHQHLLTVARLPSNANIFYKFIAFERRKRFKAGKTGVRKIKGIDFGGGMV